MCSILVGGWSLKISKIRDFLAHGRITRDDIDKGTPHLDSTRQVGPETTSVKVLIVVGGCGKLEFKIRKIGDVLARRRITRDHIDKQTPCLDSGHQIGPEKTLGEILIIVDGCGV